MTPDDRVALHVNGMCACGHGYECHALERCPYAAKIGGGPVCASWVWPGIPKPRRRGYDEDEAEVG